MSQASVYSLAQDSEGFLWVGTQNGLNRYDGRTFRHAWSDDSRVSPVGFGFIRALLVDRDGNLWVGVDSHGVYLFDRTVEVFRAVPLLRPGGSPLEDPGQVWDFAQLGDTVLVATSEGLGSVRRSDGRATIVLRNPVEPSDGCGTQITSMWAASAAELWTGTPDGCVRVEHGASRSRVETLTTAGARIWDIGAGPDDRVWVATDGRGVLVLDRHGTVRHRPRGGRASKTTDLVRSVLTIEGGDSWIGTRGGLGWIPAGRSDTTWFTMGPADDGDLPHSRVLALHHDRQGVLWVGTWNGLARLSPYYRGIGFIPKPSVPGREPLGGIVAIEPVGRDELILGALGGGLARVAVTGREPPRFEESPPGLADVYSLAMGREGDLWVATNGSGIHRRAPGGWREYRGGVEGVGGSPDDRVAAITVDRSGAVWAGTIESGLARYEPAADRFVPYRGPDGGFRYAADYIWPIVEDGHGALWFGANGPGGGIHRLSPDRAELDTFISARPEFPNAGRILTLHVSGDSVIWFGTQGRGLGRLDPVTGEIRFFTTRDGLPHDNVEAILEDRSGRLWVTTNDGLARFDPVQETFWVFRESSGLQGNRFFANSAYASESGLLFFGGPNGVNVIDPSRVVPREEPPPVVLTRFSVRGRLHPEINHRTAQAGIGLGPRENFFTIEFAALDFTEASQNAYRYRMEGLDPAWIENSGDNSASYTSVPPGRYTFRVQARSSEGMWNRSGLTVPITVHPPFYATWWFRVGALALIAALLYALYAYRLRQIARLAAVRVRIAGELHDDISADLSTIKLRSELLRRVEDAEEDSRSSHLDVIHRVASETTEKVRDMIWVVEEEHDSVGGLVERMQKVADALVGEVIDHTFVVDESVPDRPIAMEMRQDVYFAFKEALQNILRHADASRVDVQVRYERPDLVVNVVDDGRGFEMRAIERGRGLDSMERRAERHGGRVSVFTTPGRGTRVEVRVVVG